jgi:hypothetical protein
MGMRTIGRQGLVAMASVGMLLLAACGSGGSGGSGGGDDRSSSDGAPGSTTAPGVAPDDDLRLNEIQVIGTHNSFHEALSPDEFERLAALDAVQAARRTYTHPPLGEQLADQRVRQLELDVFVDAEGGRYASPAFRSPDAGPLDPAMDAPGTKVLHEQDVDYRSVCPTLVACLTEVKAWSDANPGHVPVAIHVQFKDGPLIFDVPEQVVPEKWTPERMGELDAEIRSVFDDEQLITPDGVRGDRATLEEAVLAGGWPTLGESRGKVMFLMINGAPYRDLYLQGHPNLEGRVLFTNAQPGQPDAAYVGIDDPVNDGDRITELVAAGYLVRTRSDTPGVEADANDTSRLQAALATGAHWISTDHPGPDGARPQLGTDYVAQLPGFLAARCNPVTAPPGCNDEAVEPG